MISFELNQTAGRSLPTSFYAKWLAKLAKVLKINKPLSLSIAVVGAARMRTLNRTYRGKDKVTDVLSFREAESPAAQRRPNFLGELVICYPRAVTQAARMQHSVRQEFSVLLVHGVLHLLGYQHDKKLAADKMQRLEQQILGKNN